MFHGQDWEPGECLSSAWLTENMSTAVWDPAASPFHQSDIPIQGYTPDEKLKGKVGIINISRQFITSFGNIVLSW